MSAEDATDISDQSQEFLGSYGGQHATVMMIVSAAISVLSTVIGFFFGGWKYPSSYLSLAASCIVMIFFWSNLAKFNNLVKEMKEIKYNDSEQNQIKQSDFISDQVEILKEARPVVQNINTIFKIIVPISITAIVVAIVESILCITGALWFCSCNSKDPAEKIKNFLRPINFFFHPVYAGTKEDLEAQKEEAKIAVDSSKVSVSINSWRKIVTDITATVLVATTDGAADVTEILSQITTKGGSDALGKILAFVKVVLFSLDLKTYLKMKAMYQSADDEIKRRIELLNNYQSEIEQAVSDETVSEPGQTGTGPKGAALDIGNLNPVITKLGQGSCSSFNYKTAETKDSPCSSAKTVFPKSKKPTNGGIKSLDAYMDDLDPNPIFENISRAATTQEGVEAGEFSKNAKKVKKLIPKLLKLMKKKDIKFSKDQKAKKIKPLHLQILEEGKRQDQVFASITNDLLDKLGVRKQNFNERSVTKNSKGRKVFDDKKTKLKRHDVDMGDELEDEIQTVSSDDVDYAELNQYEDLTKDINKNQGASLWKIIKVRYKKSAWDDLLPKRKK